MIRETSRGFTQRSLFFASSIISGHSKEKFLAMNRVSATSFGSNRLTAESLFDKMFRQLSILGKKSAASKPSEMKLYVIDKVNYQMHPIFQYRNSEKRFRRSTCLNSYILLANSRNCTLDLSFEIRGLVDKKIQIV